MTDTNTLRRILTDSHTIAIVGLSAKWHRPSYFVAKYLLDHGFEVIPVNPNYDQVLGQKCYPDLASIPHSVDIVDLFQRSQTAPDYARQAVAIGAQVLWLQLSVTSAQACRIAEQANIGFVEDKCLKIEHGRIFGGLNFMGVDTRIISSRRSKQIAN